MLTITPTGKTLGAAITGVDLSQPLSKADFEQILNALGQHSVLRFPGQRLSAAAVRDFSLRFGPIQVGLSEGFRHPDAREVGILSNVIENGKPVGLADAGQDWHTDMSYRETIGFVNVLYAVKVPLRNGQAIGDTLFANMHAAYEGLAPEWKTRLAGMTATHDFNKFWDNMRMNHGSSRPALTPEQRAKRPPVVHPVFMTHPALWPHGAVLQSWLRDTHQRNGRGGKRPGARQVVQAPVAGEIYLSPLVAGGRSADLGAHRHAAQCDSRLRAG